MKASGRMASCMGKGNMTLPMGECMKVRRPIATTCTPLLSHSLRVTGSWKQHLKHGEGWEILRNGEKFTGGFAKGKRHGFGTLRYPNGTFRDGKWHEGELVQWLSEVYIRKKEDRTVPTVAKKDEPEAKEGASTNRSELKSGREEGKSSGRNVRIESTGEAKP